MNEELRQDCIKHLREALTRLENPSRNANGGSLQLGGVYWRVARVLQTCDEHLDAYEGKHADYVREHHSPVRRYIKDRNKRVNGDQE